MATIEQWTGQKKSGRENASRAKKIFMAVVYGRHWLDVGKTPKRFPLNT
jgi:hypothetical protein